ncbi:sugar-phosphatase [Terrilactibacillus sp. BCM23-1]|uniref:Sugar-phosphatase n=1 Tax=Terrilactibacillus tamarindi TaxID=2599694 RepID=A0A6N8CT19_9BACI|nr:sugar-phosphatase [Terrilactibacillus tamarindi]MTT31146.1 sugar-phosphatase [Terrilactibacillus tamarindi]
MYKLIAIDMDGTLLNDQHEVTSEVRSALHAAKAKGVKIVLCTGRPIGGVRRYLKDLELDQEGDYCIAYNGALVQHTYTNEIITELSLGYSDLRRFYDLSLKLRTNMHFFDSANLYTPNKDISKYTVLESYMTQVPLHYRAIEEIPEDILLPKIMFIDEPEHLNEVIAAIPNELREHYTMVRSSPYFYEMLNPAASKGNAVRKLAETLGINRQEVICMGDNGNDLSMIEFAGCGVAMANAIPEVKEIANYQTRSNNENGVAHAIHELVLSR